MVKKKSVTIFLALILLTPVFASAFPIPDTGQTKCYDDAGEILCPSEGGAFYGQDGNYTINPPSYTKLDAQGNILPDNAPSWVMVQDNVTGLIWEMKTDDGSIHDKDKTYTWYDSNPATNGGDAGTPGDGTDTEDFINALNSTNYGGHSDWRMPTRKELNFIDDYGRFGPSINIDYFPNTKADSSWWSSTTGADNTGEAWAMNFDGGYGYRDKSYSYYVRAVRGGQSGSLGNLVINGDGTVSDTTTGLMWQQAIALGTYTWAQALDYCENLPLGGHLDWRLPTTKELDSIVDLSRWNPAINTDYFQNTVSSFYWSSTTLVFYTVAAWGMDFTYGLGNAYGKDNYYYVRAVRGGQNLLLDHLAISSPAQASTWKTGMTMPITWDTRELGGNVSISISRDGGKTFEPIAASTPNNGSFAWTVSGIGSVNCALKVTPLDDPSKATTQSLFTIDIEQGDLNNDGDANLTDALLAIQVMAGIEPPTTIYKQADVNGDDKIGIEEMIYILQKISGVR